MLSAPSPALLAWLQQSLLYLHLFAFAIAVAQVIRLDLAWLRTRHLGDAGFEAGARIVMMALAVLWASGLALILLSVGLDRSALLGRPKLVAKLIVVGVLTLNGVALHAVAVPRLERGRPVLAWTLGAISSASWTTATLIGAARHIAPMLQLADYLTGYLAAIVTALGCAWAFARAQGSRPRPASRAMTIARARESSASRASTRLN